MIVAQVDRDYLTNEVNEILSDSADTLKSRVGKTFELTQHGLEELFTDGDLEFIDSIKVRFRCKDDDGEVYYGGWLYNDNGCEVQLQVLAWAMADAGCTTIEVRPEGVIDGWKQEIG